MLVSGGGGCDDCGGRRGNGVGAGDGEGGGQKDNVGGGGPGRLIHCWCRWYLFLPAWQRDLPLGVLMVKVSDEALLLFFFEWFECLAAAALRCVRGVFAFVRFLPFLVCLPS